MYGEKREEGGRNRLRSLARTVDLSSVVASSTVASKRDMGPVACSSTSSARPAASLARAQSAAMGASAREGRVGRKQKWGESAHSPLFHNSTRSHIDPALPLFLAAPPTSHTRP